MQATPRNAAFPRFGRPRRLAGSSIPGTLLVWLALATLAALPARQAGAQCGSDPGNDYLAAASGITICGTESAAIDCAGDIDYYTFVAPSSSTITVQTFGSLDTELKIYDFNGDVLDTDDDSGVDRNALVQWSVTAGQTYFVAVNEYGYDGTGNYDLDISGCAPASCGSDPGNDTLGSSSVLSGCGTTSAAIDCSGDMDFYVLTAPVSGTYTFSASGLQSTVVTLLWGSGGSGGDISNGSGSISRSFSAGEQIYVLVEAGISGQVFSYSLEISGCAPASCGSDPGNDSTGTSTSLVGCGTTPAAIDCAGDLDYYAWQAPATGTYTWTVTPSNLAGLVLYADNGVTELDAGWNTVSSYMTQGEFSYIQVSSISSGATFSYSLEISGCSSGGCGSDPGDDTRGTATDLAGQCGANPAAIDCVGDVDYYRFTAPNGGSFTFQTQGSTDTYMVLQDDEGGQIAVDDDSGADYNASITSTLVQGTTYFIAVSEYGDNAAGAYNIEVSGCSAPTCGSDPGNDSTGTSTSLVGCGITQAAIDCAGDLDYYAWQAPATGTYTWTVTPSNLAGLVLYADNGVTELDAGWNTVSSYMTQGEFSYVQVSAISSGSTFNYSLEISGCSGGSCGSDPGNDYLAAATLLQGCGTTVAAIDCIGDGDYYRFIPPGTASYSIETTGTTDTLIKIYDANGDVIFTDDNHGSGNNGKLIETLTGGATYSIGVFESGEDATGSYDLVIQGCSPSCGSDPGNDFLAAATLLSGCGTTSAAIDCAGDLDYYRIVAPSTGSYIFETTGSLDTQLRLYDGNGDVIDTDDDSGVDRNARIAHSLVAGATYSVAVNEFLYDDTGSYDLKVSGCSSGGCGSDPGNDVWTSASVVASCGLSTFAIDCPDDYDWYTFVAPATATYTFAANSIYISTLRLFNAAGNWIDETTTSLDYPLSAGERVYILVLATTPGQTFQYDLGISGCPTGGCGNDPGNDVWTSPTVLAGCGLTSAAIDCVNDVDFYSFTAPLPGTYTVSATALQQTSVRLYDSTGTLLDSGSASVARSLVAGELVYILITPMTSGQTFSYDLGIVGCSASGCGNDPGNDTAATATALAGCGTVPAAIDCPGDQDYYAFTAPTAGAYAFGTQSTGFVDVSLFAQGGNPLAFGVGGVQYQLTAGQQVVLRLQSATIGEVFTYILGVTGCGSGSCGNDPGNDSRANATAISGCGTTDGAFDCINDVDYYRFVAPISGPYVFETLGAMDTMLWIEDAAGGTLAQNDDGGQDHNSRYQISLAANATYYLRIEEYQGNDTGSYQLQITGCAAAGQSFEYVVPATARLTGLADTDWSSDLVVLNVGSSTATVDIELWARDQDNSNPQKTTIVLTPDELEKHTDVLSSLFSLTQGAAALHLDSDQPLVVGSRTFNTVTLQTTAQATTTGTYGQYIPGVESDEAVVVGSEAYLTGIIENGDFRTNLGLVNPTGAPIQVKVDFYGTDGVSLGATQTYDVPPYGYVQKTQVLRALTSSNISGAWATLRTTSGSFHAYLSIVDQRSGDPVYKTARTVLGTNVDVVVPGIAKVAGAAGTNWLSDAVLVNTGSTEISVKLRLWLRDADNNSPQEATLQVKPKHMARVADVMQQLFSRGSGAASLQITGGTGLLVDARTYNQVTAGTYGQHIPSFEAGNTVHGGFRGFQVMAAQNATFRTNLGLVNPGTSPIDVEVRLLDPTGSQVGITKTYTVGARGYRQIDAAITQLTSQSIDEGYLEVRLAPTSLGGTLYAYASVIDGSTGDPVFEPVTVEPPPSVPAP